MRHLITLIVLFVAFAVQADADQALSLVPPANTSESTILRHYRETGVDANIRLSLIPARLQSSPLPKKPNASPSNSHISSADWPYVKRVLAQGAFEDINTGAWVLEFPAHISNRSISQMMAQGQKQMGAHLFRRFVAAHELGHSTLRRIAASGRLKEDLPNAFPNLHSDDVFMEAFCDMLAIGVLQDLYQQSPTKMARSIARYRQTTVAIEPEEAKHMLEVADLLNAYARFIEHSGSSPKGIDAQVSHALKFLGESGVFDSMLLGPEAWQRIQDEGCDDCFPRNAVRN
jgi:hypothetical protein